METDFNDLFVNNCVQSSSAYVLTSYENGNENVYYINPQNQIQSDDNIIDITGTGNSNNNSNSSHNDSNDKITNIAEKIIELQEENLAMRATLEHMCGLIERIDKNIYVNKITNKINEGIDLQKIIPINDIDEMNKLEKNLGNKEFFKQVKISLCLLTGKHKTNISYICDICHLKKKLVFTNQLFFCFFYRKSTNKTKRLQHGLLINRQNV